MARASARTAEGMFHGPEHDYPPASSCPGFTGRHPRGSTATLAETAIALGPGTSPYHSERAASMTSIGAL
jgi:hypothetical protein